MSEHQELFFGLVGATGTNLNAIRACLQEELQQLGITLNKIHLSKILLGRESKTFDKSLERIEACMGLGDDARKKEALSSVALLGIQGIRRFRQEFHERAHEQEGVEIPASSKSQPCLNNSFVFHTLKHPKEVEKLREIYGQNFYLISVYSELENRKARVLDDALSSDSLLSKVDAELKIDLLIDRDLAASDDYGQQVQKVFPLADLFLNGDSEPEYKIAVNRFVRLIFGDVRLTPTKEEFFMFQAYASAVRSGDLGRQVGASIATTDGELIAVGCNEVPKAGGGQYWCTDEHDGRDIVSGEDVNEKRQKELLADLVRKLDDGNCLNLAGVTIENFVEQAFSKDGNTVSDLLKGAEIFNLIGYYRAVHAETAALLEAAKRGTSVKGCQLYVTTFPCHECARHIVYAGISAVVYVEPYPKSLAFKHYPDSIELLSTDKTNSNVGSSDGKKVIFRPFAGIAPRQYFRLFSFNKGERKNSDGTVKSWNPSEARHRYFEPPSVYAAAEARNLNQVKQLSDEVSEEVAT